MELLNGGWPAYEFSDSSGPFSGIVRTAKGNSSLRLSSRSVAETSNRLSVEFQDESNEYQQDSLSLVDSEDVGLIGYEISSQLPPWVSRISVKPRECCCASSINLQKAIATSNFKQVSAH